MVPMWECEDCGGRKPFRYQNPRCINCPGKCNHDFTAKIDYSWLGTPNAMCNCWTRYYPNEHYAGDGCKKHPDPEIYGEPTGNPPETNSN